VRGGDVRDLADVRREVVKHHGLVHLVFGAGVGGAVFSTLFI
jgi:hypothetical protein